MTTDKIRDAIREEADRLLKAGLDIPGGGLAAFAETATDDELVRFRQLIVGAPRPVAADENIGSLPSEDGA